MVTGEWYGYHSTIHQSPVTLLAKAPKTFGDLTYKQKENVNVTG